MRKAEKKTKLDIAIARTADIIEKHWQTLSPSKAKTIDLTEAAKARGGVRSPICPKNLSNSIDTLTLAGRQPSMEVAVTVTREVFPELLHATSLPATAPSR
jgi:hypothetical protein